MKNDLPVVLIVEDEDSIRLTLRNYLVQKDFTVFVASEGVGALKIMLDNEIDVIVTDYKMEILGGDYWIKFLNRYCADKKIIITSGFLEPNFKTSFPILYKPYQLDELSKLILA